MMRDSQNSTNGEPSPALDGDSPPESNEPSPPGYYYDDATGYEIYQEEDESADEDETLDLEDD
jgi:hypothetical protein